MNAYEGNKPYIFFSYSHRDLDSEIILQKMQKRGYRIWYDYGIPGNSEYDNVIAEHIKNSDYVIALISSEYVDSYYCRREFVYARENGKEILPIFLDDVTIPSGMEMNLCGIQRVNKFAFESDEKFYEKLYNSKGLGEFLEKDPKVLLSEAENALVIDNCVTIDEIKYAKLDDRVFDYVGDALEKYYSHIPILDENKVLLGAFGHANLAKYVLDKIKKDGKAEIDADLKFGNIIDYIGLDDTSDGEFAILNKKSTVYDLKWLTKEAFNERRRGVKMFFITENGNKDEPLLGLLTPTGILGRKIYN